MTRYVLRWAVIVYVLALILGPLSMVFKEALGQGLDQLWIAVTTDAALHALKLTLIATVIATVVNTIFGIACALLLVRRRPRGAAIINAIIDLPFAVSPIVVGLALLLTYGVNGWFGEALVSANVEVIYAVPGIVLATVFVTLPFVVREVVPVLEELGDEQEQAASTLGASEWRTFWAITLPSIRWGVAYGVVLTVAEPRSLALNVAFHLRARVAGPVGVGFNLDVAGFSVGPDRPGTRTDPPQAPAGPIWLTFPPGPARTEPVPGNLLLGGLRDRGSLNSELYVSAALPAGFSVRVGYCHLVTAQNVDNERFRRFRDLASLGVSWQLP